MTILESDTFFRADTNLLGGRARVRHLFPLMSREIGEVDLQQEIRREGLVRRIDSFARFLRASATMNAELLNFKAVAPDAAVPARTVREYFGVLSDTLIAEVLEPYRRGTERKAISTGKLYFFDVGVANALCGITP